MEISWESNPIQWPNCSDSMISIGKAGRFLLGFQVKLGNQVEPVSMALGIEPEMKWKKHVAISGMTDDLIFKHRRIRLPPESGRGDMWRLVNWPN